MENQNQYSFGKDESAGQISQTFNEMVANLKPSWQVGFDIVRYEGRYSEASFLQRVGGGVIRFVERAIGLQTSEVNMYMSEHFGRAQAHNDPNPYSRLTGKEHLG